MQPDGQKDTWQTPQQAPAGAPYVAPTESVETTPSPAPVPPVVTEPEPAPTEPPVSEELELPTDQTELESVDVDDTKAIDETSVQWQAHEYIHREKGIRWYIAFGVIVVVLMAIAIFLMNAWTFAILIPVMAAALIVYTRRPPRVLDYILSRQGLHVNDRLYPFAEFKSFVVIHGDDEYSIMLIPVKRFRPGVSIYFPEESGEAIVDMLAARMPMSESRLDLMDRVIRSLRI